MKKRYGRNRHRKAKLYPRSGLILLLAVVYSIVFIAPIFVQQFKGVNVPTNVLMWQAAQDALTCFVQVFWLLFGLTVFRLIWFILWPLLCLLTGLSVYMVSTFHTQISKNVVAVFLESNSREASNFINADLILALVSAASIGIFGVILFRREKKEPRNRHIAFMALLSVIALITINGGSMATRFPPYNFLTAAAQYAFERMDFLSTPRKNIAEYGAEIHTTGDKPLVIVLVIGESARGDHFSINGYGRETTPLMQQRKNLINFKDTTSCGVWTRISVPCLLTRATEKDKTAMYTETSLISLFKSLGFYTAWLGMQNAIDFPLIDIVHEADYFTLLEGSQFLDNTMKDEQLLPLMDKALSDHPGPTLIVLHTIGSHWQYSARYPLAFERYTPVCGATLSRKYDVKSQLAEIRDCYNNHEALINSYDNSILYTDFILNEVIKRLENKNALFMFASDHGESLGENGKFLHGNEDAADNHIVPMFWWASDEFIAANQNRWQALVKKNAAPSSHDVIFHSVLDCVGVSSKLIDPALSLCHEDTPAPPALPVTVTPETPISPTLSDYGDTEDDATDDMDSAEPLNPVQQKDAPPKAETHKNSSFDNK